MAVRYADAVEKIRRPMTAHADTQPQVETPPAANAARWRKLVEDELKGVPFEKKLVTRLPEGLDLQPLYHRGMVADVPHRDTLPGQAPFLRGLHARGAKGETAWRIAQPIPAADAADFNRALLAALAGGQNAVVLPAAFAATEAGLAAALKDVDLAAAPLWLDAGADIGPAAKALGEFLAERGESWNTLAGAVTADPLATLAVTGGLPATLESLLGELASWTLASVKRAPALKTVGVDAGWVHEGGGHAVLELAVALAMGAAYLRALHERQVDVAAGAPRFAFSFAVGPQFFPELAKFRAFRVLWARVLAAFGHADAAGRASLAARTARFDKTVLDPHVNLLRTTTEALAAVLGGVDAVQVGAFDEVVRTPDDFSQRIARNIALMLAEEFNFNEVGDAAGGSWLVEKLTDDLARKAWALFQEIEKLGGFVAALTSGEIQKRIGSAANEKRKLLDTRRLALLGTNLYPNLREKPLAPSRSVSLAGAALPAKSAAGALAVTPVKPWRGAEGFEALRALADRYAKTSGKRPQVFLAKIGPAKQHKPRADFSAGFFAVGGFEAIGKESFEDVAAAAKAAAASGAPVVVLCSTDETYPTLVPLFAGALKSARPEVVAVLAGLPAEAETVVAYKNAGIDEFIHVRANVRELLAQLLAKIGAQ